MQPEAAMIPGEPLAGVVLLGGAHGTLAMARSFGRLGIPVALVTNDHPLPRWSHFVGSQFDWAGPDAPGATDTLLRLAAERGFHKWLLLPCGDAEVKLVATEWQRLSGMFRLFSSHWENLSALCDKQLLAQRATDAGVAVPRNFRVRSESDAAALAMTFPVVLKPAQRLAWNAFTRAKAWRADSREQFVARYREAAELVGAENVVVQELIEGGGGTQFSYAALWHRGAPVMEMTARRTRQYPIEFSYTSTFVEVWPNEAVRQASVKLLSAVNFEGLVEVEYKFDARDQVHKILDVNPRPWSWIALCDAAGLNLAEAMQDIASGRTPRPAVAKSNIAWIHATRDLVAALQLIVRDQLDIDVYLASLKRRLVFSTFALDDPLPAIVDIPITLYRVLTRRLLPALSGRSGEQSLPAAG
jgi:predicted ATP-grasp superfamily ATP-dependent carboligase